MNLSLPAIFVMLTALLLPASSARPTNSNFTLSSRPGQKAFVAISGETVVWAAAVGGKPAKWGPQMVLHGIDLASGRRFIGSKDEDIEGGVALGDHSAVWVDCRTCVRTRGLPGFRNTKIFYRNLRTGAEGQVAADPSTQDQPAISGRTVVWVEERGSRRVVIARNLDRAREMLLSRNGSSPAISGDTVVWLQRGSDGRTLIVGRNLRTGSTFTVARSAVSSPYTAPHISGTLVLWTRWDANGSVTIMARRLPTPAAFAVATIGRGQFNPQFGPNTAVAGNLVVWDQIQGQFSSGVPRYAIYGENIRTHRMRRITNEPGSQQEPALDGDTVVWIEVGDSGRAPNVIQGMRGVSL